MVGFKLEKQQRPHSAGVNRKDDTALLALEAAQAVSEAPEVTRRVHGHAQLQPLVPGLVSSQGVLEHRQRRLESQGIPHESSHEVI